MKSHLQEAWNIFARGCERANALVAIFVQMKRLAPTALNCDDVLRSALVLAISALDLLVHDLHRSEIVWRISCRKRIGYHLPYDITLEDGDEQLRLLDAFVRRSNSHKSFIAPDKLAECLKDIFDKPWEKISKHAMLPEKQLKKELRAIVDLRNRIVHEADVNPTYANIELWPIYEEDVTNSIIFVQKLGRSLYAAVLESN